MRDRLRLISPPSSHPDSSKRQAFAAPVIASGSTSAVNLFDMANAARKQAVENMTFL
jgi:hypothetical protein